MTLKNNIIREKEEFLYKVIKFGWVQDHAWTSDNHEHQHWYFGEHDSKWRHIAQVGLDGHKHWLSPIIRADVTSQKIQNSGSSKAFCVFQSLLCVSAKNVWVTTTYCLLTSCEREETLLNKVSIHCPSAWRVTTHTLYKRLYLWRRT